jgi:methyltransferase-like protein/SAM-dependent methyltransferase
MPWRAGLNRSRDHNSRMTAIPPAAGEAVNSYDAMPYPATAQTESHPDRLATLATLMGLTPPPVDHCRVLELGCSDGGNLISLAYGLPESEFVGADFSAQEVAAGQARIAELGLKNITLHHLDIMGVGAALGAFDYILACGVYSWVPSQVQERILELCRELLTPQGVAYINYNTYPGWFMREPVRQMLLYHTRSVADWKQRAAEARAWLGFAADAAQATQERFSSPAANRSAYVAMLRNEQAVVNEHPDSYLVHEHLEEHNEAVYFHEFVERAGRHGLQYLAEAEYVLSQLDHLPPDISQRVQQLSGDLIQQEQYLDFISNRSFRQTLLCHQGLTLRRTFSAEQLADFWVASPILPESEKPDLHSTAPEKFRNARGSKLTASHPVAKAALMHLSEIWPQATAFDTLLETARRRLDPAALPLYSPERLAHEARGVGEMLLHGFRADMVELHVCPPRFQTQISARPEVSRIARSQARAGRHVINLRHEPITIDDEITYRLLPCVDGQQDRPALLAHLIGMVQDGTLMAQAENGRPYQACADRDALLETALDQALRRLANAALLIA